MRSSNKRNLSELRQAWLDSLDSKPNHQKVLECFQTRGFATQNQIEKLTQLTDKQVRTALEELRRTSFGLHPLLTTNQVNLQGQRGRPQQVHLLTQDGSAVLKSLTGIDHSATSHLTDTVELAHALIEMEIYTLATLSKMNCQVEKILKFEEKSNIRVDALLDLPGGTKAIFEVEQTARINDFIRIKDKLGRLARFFQSPAANGIDHNIRVIFNLPINDTMTFKIWKQVMADLTKDLGSLPFYLYWQSALSFLQNPISESLSNYVLLETQAQDDQIQTTDSTNIVYSSDPKEISIYEDTLLPSFVKAESANIKSLRVIFHILAKDLEAKLRDSNKLVEGRADFFMIMRSIYEASHYEGSHVFLYSALPVDSLVLLYRYLHMHQNQELLSMARNAQDEIRRGQSRGVNLFRDTLTRFAWNFLSYHGFGRGGPLDVIVAVPGFDDKRSDIHFEVFIRNSEAVIGEDGVIIPGDDEQAEHALEWVLNALWTYANELELSHRPDRSKKAGKKQLLETTETEGYYVK